MKVVNRLVLAVSFMFASIANANVVLTLDPLNQDAVVGDLASVNITIDGLGDCVPLSLSAFDIDVAFDTSALSFVGYNLSNGLGEIDFFEAIDQSWGEVAPGFVNVSEISLLSAFDLWDFQPGSFALAELVFEVIAATAVSGLQFAFDYLVDVNGDTINIIGVNNATVTAVPAAAALALIALGFVAMFAIQKRHSA